MTREEFMRLLNFDPEKYGEEMEIDNAFEIKRRRIR